MTCYDCISVKELLASLGIQDFSCKKKIAKINRALREFYMLTYEISDNRVYEPFTTGESTIAPQYPIYHIRGFFGKNPTCNSSCWIELDRTCKCGSCDKCVTKQIKMSKGGYELDDFQYSLNCNKEIKIRVDCGLSGGYFKYSRGADKITNETDTICMTEKMLTLFQSYLDYFYSKEDDKYNKMGIFDKKFQEMLAMVMKTDTGHTIYISR